MQKPVILLIAGIVVLVVCLGADVVGIGEGTGIGWKQITGAVVGAIVAAVGVVQMRKKT